VSWCRGLVKICSVVADFDQVAQVKIGGALGDAGGLLHGVGDDDDGVLLRSSSIRSSMMAVAMGSRAEQGSSIRMTSGLTAMVRAMHSRCC
jgi:hypothetical protein